MPISSPEETIAQLSELALGALSLGRLYALRHLAEPRLLEKLGYSEDLVEAVEVAAHVDELLRRCFQTEVPAVRWPRSLNPELRGAVVDREVSLPLLEELLEEARALVGDLGQRIRDDWAPSPYRRRLSFLLDGLRGDARRGGAAGGIPRPALRADDEHGAIHQAVRGPAHVRLDPAFRADFSLIETNVPMFGETPETVAPYLWCLAIREAVASDTCALTSCEYDGLPLAFYRDMAKQCWDEMRHAVSYFQRAEALLPEALERMPEDDPFRSSIEEYLRTGTGLVVPREGNLFEMVANADLCERLVLMNIRVETPAIARLRQKINSPYSSRDAVLKRLFEYDRYDETSHSHIGIHWLKHLVPDAGTRRELMRTVDEMRAFLLLTAFVHHDDMPLAALVSHYLGETGEAEGPVERFEGWSRGFA